MTNEITVTFEGDHVHAIANGDRDFDIVRRLWTTIHDTCVDHDCHRVLGESFTTRPVSTIDVMKAPDLAKELKMDVGYRIAWIEYNSEAVETFNFIETVLINRRVYVRKFDNLDEARDWLLGT